jgi:hypothetical protein
MSKYLSENLMKAASKEACTESREDIHYNTSGTFSYLDAGGEQTIVEMATSTHYLHMRGIWLDLNTITLNGTIKVYYKVDGTNYREIKGAGDTFTVAADPDCIYLDLNIFTKADLKVTYTESADEGAARAIPYTIIYTAVEI